MCVCDDATNEYFKNSHCLIFYSIAIIETYLFYLFFYTKNAAAAVVGVVLQENDYIPVIQRNYDRVCNKLIKLTLKTLIFKTRNV